MSGAPISSAFGAWSVALFQNYLTNHFTANQLASWGVLASNAPPAAITNFDVRACLLNVASNQYHQYAVWGWGTALSQLHYQYRMVPEWKLKDRGLLEGLKVLIVPNAEAFEPADVATLQAWVTNGGCLCNCRRSRII